MVSHLQYNFDPEHNDYKSSAANGLVFSGSAQAIKIITQFISIIVMARLLTPEDFGLMAMVFPVYAFATMFSDLGFSNAVIQRPKVNHEQVNALFWTGASMGVVIMFVLCAISPLVGVFYGDPRVVPLTIAMAVLVGISGLGIQHGTIMRRRLMFRTQAVIGVTANIFGLIVAIAIAYLYQTYWALFWGMATTTLTAFLGVWICVRWMPGKPARADGAWEMIKYGLGMASGNFMGFLTSNISTIVIGKTFGTHVLGLYDRSHKILMAPMQQALFPLSGVLVPVLHRLQGDPDRYKRTFLRALGSILFLFYPGILWAVISSDSLILLLLGQDWHGVIPLFAVISLCAFTKLLNMGAKWLFETQGRSGDFAKTQFFGGVATILGVVIGAQFGIMGVVICFTISRYIVTPMIWYYACRKGVVTLKGVCFRLLPLFSGLCVSAICVYFWHQIDAIPRLLELFMGLCLSYGMTITVMLLFAGGREGLRTDIEFVLYVIQKGLNKLPDKS